MSGRKRNKAFDELGYKLVKVKNRHAALCGICDKNILNTAEARLRAHRNVCKIVNNRNAKSTRRNDRRSEDETSITYCRDIGSDVLLLKSERVDVVMKNNPSDNDIEFNRSVSSPSSRASSPASLCSSNEQLPILLASTNRKRTHSNQNPTSNTHFDNRRPTQKEETEINECLAQFFFGCNIPLSAVDSVYFKNFVKKLRPAYADKIPDKKILSTKLLDNAHDKMLLSAKATMSSDSLLLIDGWKNGSSETKTIISMLRNTNGEEIFLDAWNLSGESETPQNLTDILAESVDLAEKLYSTHVYAVVSDNTSEMKSIGNTMKHSIWKSNCSSHTASLLIKDILNSELNLKVTAVLKEFKQTNLEKKILAQGGNRIKLPSDTRWCSYRTAYSYLIENEQLMKQIAAVSKVKSNIVDLLLDVQFIDEVKHSLRLLDPVCDIIDKCQSKHCSIAEATEMWLNLKLPEEFNNQLKARQQQAVSKYALAAFYLHPLMDNAKLDSDQNNTIFEFLFKTLNGPGLEEWHSFKNKTGFFKRLFDKEMKNPLVFWSLAEMKYPNLAKIAKKLLQIPAASAQNKRILSSWARVHGSTRHRLAFGRSKKLLCLYYSLKSNDAAEPECDFE